MRELLFQVEFKSDIVLPASSNTEGKIDQLDFIPGSNFLGMAAKNYDKFVNSFDIFHSGKVRFGDGHILKDGKIPTYKIPYSFVHKKLETEPIYNHHKLKKEDFELEDKGGLGQLKQLRNGYITKDLDEVFVNYTYSQKSAYDKTNRRSLDSNMYGYKAIKKGSIWQFVVKVDGITPEDEQLIMDTLKESKRLGKSKSAEYGEVEIKFIGSEVSASQNSEAKASLPNSEIVLYCNSRLTLIDENGNPTYDLKYLCDGVEIVYDKTQIRTSTFTPYNGARKTKDYERVCINKGSVIVLKNPKPEQLQKIQNGVGAFLSEGFGEIIINPSFLMKKEFELKKECKDKKEKNKREKITQTFEDKSAVQFLVNRHNKIIDTLDIANKVADFIKDNKKLYDKKMNSQWGTIRSLCTNNNDETIEEAVRSYISKGVAKDKWDGNKKIKLLEAIEKSNHKLQFTKLLSIQMPKIKENKEQNND